MTLDASEIGHRLAVLATSRRTNWWFFDFDEKSPPDQTFWVIWEFYSEICNGGLEQYFHNCDGERILSSCEALKAIGANELVPVVESAISMVGSTGVPWNDEGQRQRYFINLPEQIRARLHDLDTQCNRRIEGLLGLLYVYLLRHRNEFDAPDEFWEGATLQ